MKNGEGGLLSDTHWTVVKQHDARRWDYWFIPPNIFKMLFKEQDYTLKYTFKMNSGTQGRLSRRVPFLNTKIKVSNTHPTHPAILSAIKSCRNLSTSFRNLRQLQSMKPLDLLLPLA